MTTPPRPQPQPPPPKWSKAQLRALGRLLRAMLARREGA
jgi:hypothetical protein